MIEIASAHWMGVQFDAPKIHDPGQTGDIVYDNFFRMSPGRKRKSDSPQPWWTLCGSALLVEGLSFSAVHEALENDGTIFDPVEGSRSDGEVIADQIKLRDSHLL
jgi:hypothetical protein